MVIIILSITFSRLPQSTDHFVFWNGRRGTPRQWAVRDSGSWTGELTRWNLAVSGQNNFDYFRGGYIPHIGDLVIIIPSVEDYYRLIKYNFI